MGKPLQGMMTPVGSGVVGCLRLVVFVELGLAYTFISAKGHLDMGWNESRRPLFFMTKPHVFLPKQNILRKCKFQPSGIKMVNIHDIRRLKYIFLF